MTNRRVDVEMWKILAPLASYNSKNLAHFCGVSVRQLERDFQSHTKKSPKDWLTEQRLEAAKMGLMAGRSVKAIAFEAGFGSAAYFCRWFKDHVGLTPGSFHNTQSK